MHKKILVIDDKKENIHRAHEQLASICHLLVANSFTGAVQQLTIHSHIDAVFTDVMLIGEADGVRENHSDIGKETPYGLIIALMAVNKGIEAVSLVTDDLGHDSSPLISALHLLKKEADNKVNCFLMRGTKDWKEVHDFWYQEEAQQVAEEKSEGLFIVGSNRFWASDLATVLRMKHSHMTNTIPEEDVIECFIAANPKCAIVFSEQGEKSRNTKFGKEKLVAKLRGVAKPWQIVFAAGFDKPATEDHLFLRLPFSPEEFQRRLEEARKNL